MSIKTGNRSAILKMLASSSIAACACAGIVSARAAIFGDDGGAAALLMFLASVISAKIAGKLFLAGQPGFAARISRTKAARFIAFMLDMNDFKKTVASAAAWAFMLIPLSACLLIYGNSGTSRAIFELAALAAAYAISLKHALLSSANIMSNTAVFWVFFILVAALEIPNIFGRLAYLKPWLHCAAYFFMLAFLVVRNQEDIDVNIFDRKHVEKSVLPKNMRTFNTMSVCVLFIIALLLFNLKSVVIAAARLVGRLTILAVAFFAWLAAQILPAAESATDAAPPGDFVYFGAAGISPVGNFILNILRNFTILYVLYRVLYGIAAGIPAVVRAIAGRLSGLFTLKADNRPAEESDYVDESETIKPVRSTRAEMEGKKPRKARKNPMGMADPAEKIRCMYAVTLGRLQSAGIKTEPCDTTLDILGKAASVGNLLNDFSILTAIYNLVRYGGTEPGAEMVAEAEKRYLGAAEALKNR